MIHFKENRHAYKQINLMWKFSHFHSYQWGLLIKKKWLLSKGNYLLFFLPEFPQLLQGYKYYGGNLCLQELIPLAKWQRNLSGVSISFKKIDRKKTE